MNAFRSVMDSDKSINEIKKIKRILLGLRWVDRERNLYCTKICANLNPLLLLKLGILKSMNYFRSMMDR